MSPRGRSASSGPVGGDERVAASGPVGGDGRLEQAVSSGTVAQAELVNAARLATLGRLSAGIAHELNTPMGALHSNHDVLNRALERLHQILEDDVVDETEIDELRRIVRAIREIMRVNTLAVERMVALVKSLRNFGRLDRSEIDRVDVHDGLETTLALLRHELSDGIEVVREYGELPNVECYPQQLNQVFMNLLLNACHAIRAKGPAGTITIRTGMEGDDVLIQVSDTGTGIAADHLERIFEPGFTTKGARVGMGLGLPISNQIVGHHGGRFFVKSELGKGTTFSVRLPLELPDAGDP